MLKRYFVITAVLLVLIGCRDQTKEAAEVGKPQAAASPVEAEVAAAPRATAPIVADPGKSCLGQPGCEDLPPGVAIKARHELRSGRIYISPVGKERRQVAFEILEGDAAATLQAFKQSLVDAGFVIEQLESRENGVQGIKFNMDGYGVVHVWINPSVGPKPINPEAKNLLGIDMPNVL